MSKERATLGRTPVGRRLIALLTIFNNDDSERLRQFIDESCTPTMLEEMPLDSYRTLREQVGKLRVIQVLVSDEHRVAVLTEAQNDGALCVYEMAVESDYPHKIIQFMQHEGTKP